MGMIDTPRAVNEQRESASTYELNDIIANISVGEYALVIGPEVILDARKYFQDNSENVLVKQTIEKIECEQSIHFPNKDEIRTFSNLTEIIDREKVKQVILRLFNPTIEKHWECAINDVNPSLKALLQSGFFNTIITTGFDSYVENILRGTWGDDLKVVNMCDTKDVAVKQEKNAPVLYYAFGKADYQSPDNSSFVLSDFDRLRTVKQLMTKENLFRSMNEHSFLAIGCDLDDWLFRFFWFALTEGNDPAKRNKVVRRFNEQSNSDFQLKKYLQGLNVLITDADNPRKFIDEIQRRLQLTAKNYLKDNNRRGGIFISYAHEDLAIAMHLYKVLRSDGFNVWMDIRMESEGTSQGYEKDIEDALSESSIFLIILSGEVQKRMTGESAHGYLIDTEWKQMLSYLNPDNTDAKNRKIIFPVAVKGYNERDKGHQFFEDFFCTRTTVRRLDSTNTSHLPIENVKMNLRTLLDNISNE